MTKHKSPLRRPVLASLALLGLAGPAIASGCGAGFAPMSQVNGLRVLAAVADKPYAQPGETVTFKMTYADPPGTTETPQILWFGTCINPAGGNYFSCYKQLEPALAGLASASPELPPGFSVGLGATYTITLPSDILSASDTPGSGSAFVFFAACVGGNIMPLPGLLDGGPASAASSGGGAAGEFPLGCFDADMQQLPAANFVPGYTEVFAFSDGRVNNNPTVYGLSINQAVTDAGILDQDTDGGADASAGAGMAQSCTVPEANRLGPSGCGMGSPFTQCKNQGAEYQITVDVDPDAVSEIDPSGKMQDGAPLYEVVWVDYFADQGDLDNPTVLLAAATGEGAGPYLQKSYSTNWIAPPAPASGTLAVDIWAVVHDSRGGEAVAHAVLQVP